MFASGQNLSGVRQLLLQHAYSPLVSVQSTHNADSRIQKSCRNQSISVLSVLKPYGNTVKYGVANQTYRITNTQLITRNYGSFPVRFEPSLPELLTVHNPSEDKLSSLFSISSLELLMKKASMDPDSEHLTTSHDLYSLMFRKVISSNRVVSFDTLNHPVAQIFVVDFELDTLESIRRSIVEFRNYAFPKYFQNSDLLVHVFVLYDKGASGDHDISTFQATLRTDLSVASTLVPISTDSDGASDEMCVLPELENATIEQEVQNITLRSAHANEEPGIKVPRTLDSAFRNSVFEFISRFLIPHMERKIRTWDDAVLAPKKSITGRFFSVSKKLFNSSTTENASQSTTPGTYNHASNYYHRSAPEQIIRKLADWSLMLKDFKYAYSTYDLIKKDYVNEKAWAYVAATQEMCIVSLLLAQTQPLGSDSYPSKPDKNTLRKIRHDIIEPYVDNLSYTYKSRFNVKTYAVRAYLIVAELLLNMSMMFNIPWWWSDLIEDYFMKAEHELEAHLALAEKGPQATRAIIYERLAFVKRNSYFVPSDRGDIIDEILEKGVVSRPQAAPEEGFYVNNAKMLPYNDNAVKGLTRFRKCAFWYILAMREWMLLGNITQIKSLMQNFSIRHAEEESRNEWSTRENLVLARIRHFVSEPSSLKSMD